MNTKRHLTILLFALLALIANAADKPQAALTVAVYDFKGDSDATHFDNKVTTFVTANLASETNLVMLERADLSEVLNEQAFGISGMVSSDAAAKIGQVTGVKVLIAGQVIKTEGDHLVIVASIIGTETGRLFAAKVEGPADHLINLTLDLSRKIAQTIALQATNLVTPVLESHEERVEHILKSIEGKNRPSVSINFTANNGLGQNWRDGVIESELGAILLKAGLLRWWMRPSGTKPDLQITGSSATETGLPRGGLLTGRATVELKIQERRTGNIISFDRQETTATDLGVTAAAKAAQIKAVDDIAERIPAVTGEIKNKPKKFMKTFLKFTLMTALVFIAGKIIAANEISIPLPYLILSRRTKMSATSARKSPRWSMSIYPPIQT